MTSAKKKSLALRLAIVLVGLALILIGATLSRRYNLETVWGEPDLRHSLFQGKEYRDFETMRLLGRQCPSCSGWW